MMNEPLAYRMRPLKLDDVIGQKHLVGPGMILRRCVEEKRLFSLFCLASP